MEKISKGLCEEIKHKHLTNQWDVFYKWLDSITEKESDLVKGLKEIREDHDKEEKKKIEPLEDYCVKILKLKNSDYTTDIADKVNEVIEWINNQ